MSPDSPSSPRPASSHLARLRPWRARALAALAALAAPLLFGACGGDESPPADDFSKGMYELTGQLVWPISGFITQNSAPPPGHPGVDIGAVVGTPIFAAASGVVVVPFNDPGGYGCNVVINHSGGGSLASGFITVYGHMSDVLVAPNTKIDQGTLIGFSGGAKGAPCAGNSGGPHLHFEIRHNLAAVRSWDGSVHVGSNVKALDRIDTYIEGLPAGTADCEAACANFGCHCVDGQCSGGFCPGTGCTADEAAACGNFGVNCVDHQCSGGFGPGTGCTARETIDCGNFGANCVDHQCSGGFGAGTGCTAREMMDCGNFGANCVDHQCSGGFGEGTGCTVRETLDCQGVGCGCVDHQCSGGFCPGNGCTAHMNQVCMDKSCGCDVGVCKGGSCP